MSLDDLRDKIDGIDRKLVDLLNERTEAATEIGKRKASDGAQAYVPAREKAVLKRVADLNKGPLPDSSMQSIFREVMSGALATEAQVRVAYLGPAATFTHHAARSRFGTSVEYVACESVWDVFNMVETGDAGYGVVAIENAINGPVIPVLDRLVDTSLKVYAEIVFPISQCLLSRSARDGIKQIHSHPQALAQCQRWLRMELPGVDLIPTSSTAKAAELASREDGVAAIGSSLACEIYGLNVVAEHIEDVSGNETRFMILASKYGDQTGDDKTSIVFSVRHNVGSLYDALQSFRKFGLNMTKIESRPSKNKAWEYYFFVDFEGHADDEKVKEALVDLGQHCIFLKVLGSYPKAP